MTQRGPTLTAHRAGPVPEDATVRHVDQLSEDDLEAFVRMTAGEPVRASGLNPDDVIVFAGYYRIARTEQGKVSGSAEAATDGGAVVVERR
ncbi:hypothetical protein HUG10_01270 [Halorarum halophilum]|uniref:Uncharacterized protein n=1 Tax=Halorarum halophilum TaxID=2743090 RepID=A0A7D5GA44_9EURY|nr:hypothetical protein [Halobaculum halophilum]QLG26252.1 hypothetical protein HUG10_01270 [Halobaculum halophilum]